MSQIRLRDWEIEEIVRFFRQTFPAQDHLWLFGSRVKPEAKGGDIDLYVETTIEDPDLIVQLRNVYLVHLKEKLGEQKIDLVIKSPGFTLPIHEVAKKEGIQLV